MDQDQTVEPIAATADEAFEALQAELSLLRRGIEALTVERQAAPDYAPSFARIEKQYEAIRDWAKRLAETPVLKLDPAKISEEIDKAAAAVRKKDRETITAAERSIEKAVEWMRLIELETASAKDQTRQLHMHQAICLLLGMATAFGITDAPRIYRYVGSISPRYSAIGPPPNKTIPANPASQSSRLSGSQQTTLPSR